MTAQGLKGFVVTALGAGILLGGFGFASAIRNGAPEAPSTVIQETESVSVTQQIAPEPPETAELTAAKAASVPKKELPAPKKAVSKTANSSVSPSPTAPDQQKIDALEKAAKEAERAIQDLQKNLDRLQNEKKAATLAPLENPNFEKATTDARAAIVNILCESKSGGIFNPISASGIIIDARGVILTNAHVAQYFLLEDYLADGYITCTIRTGSPAKNTYRAKLLYISPTWIAENATTIVEQDPLGTGEADFGLLLINEPTMPGTELPSAFPALPFSTERVPPINESVLLSGYPSGFLGGITVQTGLYQLSSIGNVSKLYTFEDGGSIDVIEVGGSLLSQKGSSGGGLVDGAGRLLGIIATAELDPKTTIERSVRAITLGHIDRQIQKETGKTLADFLAGNLRARQSAFESALQPSLAKILIDAIEK